MMIQIKYKLLFEIEILHTFYRSGKCPDFRLAPTHTCKIFLNSFGLRFLPTSFGGQIYARVNPNETIKNPLTEGSRFSFSMELENPDFENFSETNILKPKQHHYYFNNLTENLSAEDSSPLLIASSTLKRSSDADLLPFAHNSFSYRHENTSAIQDSSLLFIDSGEAYQQQLGNHNNVFNFNYDLKKTGGGRAKFFVEEVEKAVFYVLPVGEMQDVFGMVEIFYKNNLTPEYQFQNNDLTITAKSYKVVFTNRSTRWRYIISTKYNKALTGIRVGKTTGSPISFTSIPDPPVGQLIIASDQPVPLREDPVTGLQLSDQADKVLIAHLPNPPLGLVKTEGSDTFSDILLTL